MADSYRLTVLKRLTAHLEGITPANGAAFDLSASIFRGRTIFGQDDPIPMVSILEAPRPDIGLFAGEDNFERSEHWNLYIQGWTIDDVLNPTDPVYALLDAVERRLFRLAKQNDVGDPSYPDEYMLGRKIASITISPGVCRPPMEQVSSKAFFYLPIRLGLVRDSG